MDRTPGKLWRSLQGLGRKISALLVRFETPLPGTGAPFWYYRTPPNNNKHKKMSYTWVFNGSDREGNENCDQKAGFLKHLTQSFQDALSCTMTCHRIKCKTKRKIRAENHSERRAYPDCKVNTQVAVLQNSPESFATCYPRWVDLISHILSFLFCGMGFLELPG